MLCQPGSATRRRPLRCRSLALLGVILVIGSSCGGAAPAEQAQDTVPAAVEARGPQGDAVVDRAAGAAPAGTACVKSAAPSIVTIAAAGDLLMHVPVVHAAKTPDGWDFSAIFAPVAPLLSGPDLTLANLETTFGGQERGVRGYPRFSTPDELADAVRGTGVDVLITANNHALDSGAEGVVRTLEVIRGRGLRAAGTRARPGDPPFALLQAAGTQVAVLAYTYGTNGLPVPEPHLINLIDRGRMAADVRAARAAGADIIVAALHWGEEYALRPTPDQQDLARYLAGLGVDAVFGTHPHVVQPFALVAPDPEVVHAADDAGNLLVDGPAHRPRHHPVPVFYSTGNFVSNQRQRYRDAGIVAAVTLRIHRGCRGAARRVELVQATYAPVWVHRYFAGGRWRYRVVPADPEPASRDPLLGPDDLRRLEQVRADLREILGEPPLYGAPGGVPAARADSRRNSSRSASAASTASCQKPGCARLTPR